MTEDDTQHHRVTTDRETIRKWAEEYGMDPVRTTETGAETGNEAGTETTAEGSSPYRLHPESDRAETMETLTWDEFFDHLDRNDLVIVSRGESADRPLDVLSRDRAMSRASLDAGEFEERLTAGETVTSEVTETTVVERTIVEHATIESEIVDTEVLDERVVDVELRSREIGGCNVVGRDLLDDVDRSRFEDVSLLTEGYQEDLPPSVEVEVDVEEDWTVTRELLERATIESRIVDVDTTETEEVEAESIESSIEIEGVQRALLDSDVIDFDADTEEVIQGETIESEFHEDDVVRTQLNQQRIIEEEFSEQKTLRGELTESEILRTETMSSTPLGTTFVDRDTLDAEGTTDYGTETGYGTGAETTTARGEDVRTQITQADEGKPVVSASGDKLALVEEVRENTAYINPEPGIVDRIKSKMGWGDADEGDFTITEEDVGRITDEKVELRK